MQDAIHQTETKIDDLRSFLLTGAGRLSDLKNLQARYQESIERISARTSQLENQGSNYCPRTRRADRRSGTGRQELPRKGKTAEGAGRELRRLRGQSGTAARLHMEPVSGELSEQVNEHGLMQHRYSSLEEVERRRSNYSEGVQKFLSARVPGEEGFQAKTLADHIETDPAYEAAMEDYLNDPLQYILVESRDDAVHSIDRLKRIGAGKCTFMTLRNGHTKHEASARPQVRGEGVVGYLDDLLHMSPEIRDAFERALPEYASTIMVSDLNTAFQVAEDFSGANFLTLSGESYSPRGTLSAVGERKSMAGFLALKREKRELGKKLNVLQEKIQATKAEAANLKQEQTSAAEFLKVLTAESRKLRDKDRSHQT